MNIFRSIKWRLQLWYGLILVFVLAGFGFASYQLERNRQFGRIDQELHRRFASLADVMRQGRPPERGRRFTGAPPPEQMPEDGPPPRELAQGKFILPTRLAGLFDTNQPGDFYFVVVNRDGVEIARGGGVPVILKIVPDDAVAARENPPGMKNPRPSAVSTEGGFRQLKSAMPSGEIIVVGCSLASEMKELRRTIMNLVSLGGSILLIGLVGGWWLVGRALRPVEEISATAGKISAGDLSQRINVAEAKSELGQLAAVLNSTFARLEAAFAQQKQFASDAAHELRTPVTVILTQTQMALARERDAADYKQAVEACQRAAQRMRRLIESLLELARFDAGQEVLKRMDFDFGKTVSDSVELVQTLAEEKSVKIISVVSPLEISGDPERLAQVVTNLLTNAIQYNRPDGEVRVELRLENGLAVLKISDTGQGIAPEDLPRVFERFYRADKSRTGAGNVGLGLSICKAIVEAHGGTIEVASEPNVGTTFTVRLPV